MARGKKNGFTLIELLVSIVVLGVISAIGLTTYFHAQTSGRDGRRKQDIRSIQIAVNLYSQRFGHYPCTGGTVITSTANLPNWIFDSGCSPSGTLVPNLIEYLPVDPINTGSNIYRYQSLGGGNCNLATDGGGYVLVAVLENGNDRDAIDGGSRKLCNGTSVGSGSWGAAAFIVSND